MHYWRKDSFDKLDSLRQRLSCVPELAEYVRYLELLSLGLRKDALKHIEDLLSTIRALPNSKQREIASILCRETDHQPGHCLIPNPLHCRFIAPVITDWAFDEPNNPEPLRWTGILADLIRAVEIDPSYDDTRRRLILCILGFVGYSTHELPIGYLGVIEDDYALLRVAKREALLLCDPVLRDNYLRMIDEEKRNIDEYNNKK